MAHDVFISHSAKDKAVAESICAALEKDGISCWIAPRNITPGRKWGGAIIDAINGSKVIVLVFSQNANESQQILREVERSVNKGIPVIPFRIDEVNPNKDLEYYIMTEHWLDAYTKPLEQHITRLRETVKSLVPYKEGIEGGNGSNDLGDNVYGHLTTDDERDLESEKAAEEIDRLRESGEENGGRREDENEDIIKLHEPDPVPPTPMWKKYAAAIAAAVVFIALGAYFGILVVFIPAVCIVAAWWLVGNFRQTRKSPMFPALALTGGHILWFIVGIISIASLQGSPDGVQLDPSGPLVDAFISAALFVWLLIKPGRVSGIANVLGTLFFLIAGLTALSESGGADPFVVKATLLHTIFYAATLVALVYGIIKTGKTATGTGTRTFAAPK